MSFESSAMNAELHALKAKAANLHSNASEAREEAEPTADSGSLPLVETIEDYLGERANTSSFEAPSGASGAFVLVDQEEIVHERRTPVTLLTENSSLTG